MRPRQARAEDRDAIAALTEAAYEPYTKLLGAPPMPVTDDHAGRIADGESWLLEDPAGALVGVLVLERHEDHALIYSVAVSPGHQGKGHGLALMRFGEEKARDWGLAEMRLFTNSRMERNIALYEAFGYRETGREPNPYRPGWILVHMAKRLDGGSI